MKYDGCHQPRDIQVAKSFAPRKLNGGYPPSLELVKMLWPVTYIILLA